MMSKLPARIAALVLVAAAALAVSTEAPSAQLLQNPGAASSEAGETAETPSKDETAETAAGAAPATGGTQLKALAEALRDEAVRRALISEIERLAAEPGESVRAEAWGDAAEAAPPPADAAEAAPQQDEEAGSQVQSFIRDIAKATQAAAENAIAEAKRMWTRLKRAPQTLSTVSAVSPDLVIEALIDLAIVIATTVAIFLLLRRLAKRLLRGMGRMASRSGPVVVAGLLAVSAAVAAGVVVLAWAGGYAVNLLAVGAMGEIGIRQTLYLNAFLMVELAKVALLAVLSPTTSGLRLVPMTDHAAKVMARWLGVAVAVIGYTELLVVPIISNTGAFFAARGVSTLAALIGIGIVLSLVLANRRAVADWLLSGRGLAERSGLTRALAQRWHQPLVIYLFGLTVIVLTRPGDVLLDLLFVSGEILAALLIGAATAGALGKAMRRGVRLPAAVNARLPLLERRLNTFVPGALTAVQVLIVIVVIGFTLNALGLFDAEGWLAGPTGRLLVTELSTVSILLLAAFSIWVALSSWVDWRLNPGFGRREVTAREQTLLTLLRNAATIAIVVITSMFVLSEIGIDIAPLIASAGVFGLAIGFGAQKLVQDIITGIFIQFENAINVGDVITVAGVTGTVERLTIRSVSLRDVEGTFHIIPFSSVDMVSNFMRGFGYYVCNMGVGYSVDVGEAKQAMFDAFEELQADPDQAPNLLEDLQWHGLNTFGDSAIVLRARIKCAPGTQWGVGRAYNGILKRIFDERGIEIPFPHQTIYFGDDGKGKDGAERLRDEARRRGGDKDEAQPGEGGPVGESLAEGGEADGGADAKP